MTPASSVRPRQLPRLARTVAMILAGVALTATHALAQELGVGLRMHNCATNGGGCTPPSQLATVALCQLVAFAAITGMVRLRRLDRHPRQVNPTVMACIFLAAFIAAGAGAWMAAANPLIFEKTG